MHIYTYVYAYYRIKYCLAHDIFTSNKIYKYNYKNKIN